MTSILTLPLSLHSIQFLVDMTDFHCVFSDIAPKNERKHIKLLLVPRVLKISMQYVVMLNINMRSRTVIKISLFFKAKFYRKTERKGNTYIGI